MTDRKTPMQRYRDVADRELLRRVAVLVRDRMAKWVFEKRTRDFAVETCNIDWMIDRVLADAPPSRSPLVAEEAIRLRGVRDAAMAAAKDLTGGELFIDDKNGIGLIAACAALAPDDAQLRAALDAAKEKP